MSKLLRKDCGWGPDCPAVELTEGGDVHITGYRIGAPQTPDNEQTVAVPGRVVPELTRLDIPNIGDWLAEHLHSPGDMLRVQTLDRYGAEDAFVDAYHRGDPAPSDEDMPGWVAQLQAYRLAGQRYRNLHVIDGRLSREMEMQFGWAYRFNARHGMDIRVLDVSQDRDLAVLRQVGDFWAVEGEHVALCRYDDDGRPLGCVECDTAGHLAYIALGQVAWQRAVPFADWWAAHPHYHRDGRRAA